MGTPYTWHPGTLPVGGQWAVLCPLLPDEALSSWLVRAALAQGCDPLVLTASVWGRWRVWAMDCDRHVPSSKLTTMAKVSGLSADNLHAATYHPIICRIAGHVPPNRYPWPWITPFGRRNRKCVQGWSYCPRCLAADRNPYFRLSWRLAWHTGCATHGISLRDHCPHCEGPVLVHRHRAESSSLAECALCGGDLRVTPLNRPHADVALQAIIDQAAGDGVIQWGAERIASHLWFDLAHYFIGWLRVLDGSGRRRLLETLLPDAATLSRPGMSLRVETLPIEARAEIVETAFRLALCDPQRFKSMALEVGLTQAAFRTRRRLPVLLASLIGTLPVSKRVRSNAGKSRTCGPRSRMEIERMWRHLQRKAGLR